MRQCAFCRWNQPPMYRCVNCKMMYYCSRECQRADWDRHRIDCAATSEPLEKERVVTDIHQTRMMSPSSGYQRKN